MSKDFNKNLHWYLLLAFLVSFVLFVYQSEGTAGGADDLNHYRYARYSFDYPGFLFDTKAKTVFTLLRAPVAQLGYNALRVMNVLLGLGTALLIFLTARRLKYGQPVLSLFLLVFAPVYAVMMLSGMNEIMFSFFLALGIYLFFRNYGIWSAVVISLLPFIRTEGFVVFPFFMMGYMLNRQWRALPFLLSGFLLVSFAGSFHHGDFFWVISKNPYSGDAFDIYGSGPLFYYVDRFNAIFGFPFFVLIAGGLLLIPLHYFRIKRYERRGFYNEVLVGFMPFLVYFAAHSYVYWKGKGNSVGELRVMAAVFPSAVLLAMFTWNKLLKLLGSRNFVKAALGTALAVVLLLYPFGIRKIPVELWPPQKLVKEAVSWIEEMEYTERKMYFWDPHWWFYLDANPTDRTRMHEGFPNRDNPSLNTHAGEIVLWDAHYGPNEGRTPLEMLANNPDFCEIKVFRPEHPFTVLGGYNYELHIFERLENRSKIELQAVLNEIQEREDSKVNIILLEYIDFEPGDSENESSDYCGQYSRSGSNSYYMKEDMEFLEGLVIPAGDIKASPGSKIKVEISHYSDTSADNDPLLLVVSLQSGNKMQYYRTWEIQCTELDTWENTSIELDYPESSRDKDILKVYLWNKAGCRVYLDDFIITLREPLH